MKRTYVAKPGEVERKWWVVDLDGKILGRAAVEIAKLLRGKGKPEFTPHVDVGDFVIVINARKVKLTGKKYEDKLYYWHSGYPGGLKVRTARQMLEKKPEEVVWRAVWGMMPKNKLSRRQMKKLKIYAGDTHPHQAQKPEPYPLP